MTMTLQFEPFMNQVSSLASQALEHGKAAAIWSGHVIKEGYTRYAIPATRKVAEFAKNNFELFQKSLQNGPGPIFALAGGLLIIGISSFKMADRKAYESDMLAKSLWQTSGVVSFIGATVLTSFAIFTALT